MSEELKPCPFCGEIPAAWHDRENTYYWCKNKNCLMSKDKPFMYLDWNNRPLEDELQANLNIAVEAMNEINDWTKAYPIDIFPEPDFGKIKELLGSKMLTQLSASNMRHVVDSIKDIVQQALQKLEANDGN